MSNHLGLSQIAATQSNKHVTANDQAGQLDAALTEILPVAVDDANAASLTTEQLQRHFFFDIDPAATPPNGAVTITVPAIQRGLFAVRNNTAQEVTVTISGQSPTAPAIGIGEAVLLSNDGTDVRAASSGIPDLGNASIGELLDVDISGIAAGQQLSWNGTALVPVTEPFDVGLHLPDLSTAGALLAEIVLARPVDFPAAFSGSTGYARIAATAETVLDVQKNGANIGTITFAAASATPTFALASATSFAAGDRLGLINEDPADATLAGVSLTFAGTRGS